MALNLDPEKRGPGQRGRYSDYATGWAVRGSNPGRGEIFRTHPDRPWTHLGSYTMGTGSLCRG
jgi:hypothetical protein